MPSNRAERIAAYNHITTGRRQLGPKGGAVKLTSNDRSAFWYFVEPEMPTLRSEPAPNAAEAAANKCVKTRGGFFTFAFATTLIKAHKGCTSRFRRSELLITVPLC